ncbi:MAG: hypothetical protein ACPL7O_05190, partial [Armatimonadota bacterium]
MFAVFRGTPPKIAESLVFVGEDETLSSGIRQISAEGLYTMRKVCIVIVAAVLVACCLCPSVQAVDASIRWVEVDISPHSDGKADIIYKIRWHVRSGQMHGFYIQGFGRATPHFDIERSRAFDANGRVYGVSISEVSPGKYDVILANGQAAGPGDVTYAILYGADLAGAGMLDYTESQYGRLVVFNWAPVQWDKPLEHETVYLH